MPWRHKDFPSNSDLSVSLNSNRWIFQISLKPFFVVKEANPKGYSAVIPLNPDRRCVRLRYAVSLIYLWCRRDNTPEFRATVSLKPPQGLWNWFYLRRFFGFIFLGILEAEQGGFRTTALYVIWNFNLSTSYRKQIQHTYNALTIGFYKMFFDLWWLKGKMPQLFIQFR